jgi:carboxylesterase type B
LTCEYSITKNRRKGEALHTHTPTQTDNVSFESRNYRQTSTSKMPLTGFLRTAHAVSWAVALEGYHSVHYYITIVCRLADLFLPHLVVRWLRYVLRRRRTLVKLPSGMCIGERVPSVPFHQNRRRCKCFKFEGVPYATLPNNDRFAAPQRLLDEDDDSVSFRPAVLNRPRFLDLGYRFGAAASIAPQTPGILTVDTPVLAIGIQALIAKYIRGYAGDAHAGGLQLNLWVPATHFDGTTAEQRKKHRYPVLVFFHGGAFIFGSCHQTIANGQSLCERGECIVVSCNYRLGILGYLNVPEAACQNRGLRDQVAALEWVKRNIAHFGGDADNITVAGQSAGSMSVGALLGVEATYRETLFHKAVMISGCAQYLPTKRQSEDFFDFVAATFGTQSKQEFAKTLHTMPLAELIALQERVDRLNARAWRQNRSELILPFQPFIEGVDDEQQPPVLPYHPIQYLRYRRQRDEEPIPLLIGSTREEYTFFTRATVKMFPITRPSVSARVRQWVHTAFGVPIVPPAAAPLVDDLRDELDARRERAAQQFAEKVEWTYENSEMAARTGEPHSAFTAINGDYLFRLPAEFLANMLARNKQNVDVPAGSDGRGHVWVYRFDRPAVIASMGATHASDLHYFFNTWWCPPYYTGGWSRAVAQLAGTMGNDLLTLMRDKEVGPDTLPWPQWDCEKRPQRLYGSPESADSRTALACDPIETQVWGDVFEQMLRARGEAVPS